MQNKYETKLLLVGNDRICLLGLAYIRFYTQTNIQRMRNLGLPSNRNSPAYRADTSKHKRELLDTLKRSESLWKDQRTEESIVLLKQAITTLKFIITNESIQTVKISFEEKLQQLEARLTARAQTGNKQVFQGNYGPRGKVKEENQFKGQMIQNILTEKPNVRWNDISGLEGAKAALKEAVLMPQRFKKMFTGCRKPWKGILLYGPPGTGKTFLAKACATEASSTFFSVQSSKILSKFVGESEKMISSLFALAREKKPSIIFIDEIDALCSSRSQNQNEATKRVKSEFLTQMQGVGNDDDGVLILGATNFPQALDFAIRRRFERRIYIPLPQFEARYGMFKRQLTEISHILSEKDLEELAKATEGYSGSDIKSLIKDAVYEPIRLLQRATRFIKTEKGTWRPCQQGQCGGQPRTWLDFEDQNDLEIESISMKDFVGALQRTKPSVDQKLLKKYEEWTSTFGQEG